MVLGMSSSEPVLPRLLLKLECLGCKKGIVGLVLPTGYSFNLDGTAIYLTLASMFIAQACDVRLSWIQTGSMLGVMLLTSKGGAGVTGTHSRMTGVRGIRGRSRFAVIAWSVQQKPVSESAMKVETLSDSDTDVLG